MNEVPASLRDRTRMAVKREITDAASALFAERGYKATTIDDIAAAIGMSQRSVYRYFPTKEALVIGKFDFVADGMLEALRERPAGEPLWESLRRVFDVLVVHADGSDAAAKSEPIQQIVFETPAILAVYLQRLQQLQDAVVAVVIARAQAAGMPHAKDDPAPRALTGAAFGCLVAAQHSWLAGGRKGKFANAIDRAMRVVRPLG